MANPRVKELIFSAAQFAVDHTSNNASAYEGVFLSKYTDLIIEECCEALWTEECHTSDVAYIEWLAQCSKIKDSLGVLA